ncbi:efflux RND transporter permease subunit [bacterium]|nr:efflux RND transporter permease subunit [bacterium]
MSLPALCVRRPVFTAMLAVCPIVLGIASYARIGIDLFPNVDLPIVTVTTTLPGASVEEMETGVTKPIEEAVNTVSGIDELKSTTKEGLSVVNVTFILEKNRDVAAQEVRDKVSTILATLPAGTQNPVIDKFDLDASPVLTVAISGKRSLREVSEIADKQIREGLESLDGVGQVTIAGARLRAINAYVEAPKLEAYGLSIEQVRAALVSQNLELPGGRVDQAGRELVLRTMGRVKESADFEDVIVANAHGQPIRMHHLGRVEDGESEARSLARLNGANAVTLIVQKQSGTNTLEVINRVKAKLASIQKLLPADIRLKVTRDQAIFIEGSYHEVKKHLILGAIFVALTIYLFLRDWRTMVLAGLSIPISIVSNFTFMNIMGFTLNSMTMLGLVLAVGIVIDDAIVVHENIFRWMEEKGYGAYEAAQAATAEIALAVLATTSSLIVIFLPIAFMSGRVGRFFQSFGITIAFAIAISLGISMTLTPMLCSRFLRVLAHKGAKENSGYAWLCEKPYMLCLRFAMRHRWVVVLASIAVLVSVVPLFMKVGKDFFPKDDQSEFEVAVTTPEGWTLDRVDRELALVEARIRELPGVEDTLTTIGDTSGRVGKGEGDVTKASIYVSIAALDRRLHSSVDRLVLLGPKRFSSYLGVPPVDPELEGLSQFALMRRAREVMKSFPDLRASIQLPTKVASGAANADIEFNVLGPSLDRLGEYGDEIIRRMRKVKGIVDVDNTLALRKPELRVEVDREKAMDLGIPIQAIASTLQVLVGGKIVTTYKDDAAGEQYDVWLRADKADRDDPETVERLTVPSPVAGLVRVANLARLTDARGPSQIDRFARQRKVTIVANTDNLPTGAAVDEIQKIVRDLDMPPAYTVSFTGRAKTFGETGGNFAIAFGLSIIFMYMILAAQFESFVHPVTILLALPLVIPFALLSLIALGSNLDIYSVFGLFLLFGIVKKNGILQVDYTNVLRERGIEREAAILEANKTRLRPILMTTVMLIAGMVPIALGVGPGAASRAGIAKVIIGGQLLSLLLSLLLTPVAYSYFDDVSLWFKRTFGSREKSEAAHEEKPVTSP